MTRSGFAFKTNPKMASGSGREPDIRRNIRRRFAPDFAANRIPASDLSKRVTSPRWHVPANGPGCSPRRGRFSWTVLKATNWAVSLRVLTLRMQPTLNQRYAATEREQTLPIVTKFTNVFRVFRRTITAHNGLLAGRAQNLWGRLAVPTCKFSGICDGWQRSLQSPAMGTKSREIIYGGWVRAAK
jgi:hypothetical protein